jgi:DNA polymerase-3 subunit beta
VVIVPTKALSLLGRLTIDPATRTGVKLSRNQLSLDAGRAKVNTALVEGQFPRYQDVIPTDMDRTAQLNTAEFLSALKRAALLTNEESKGVRFAFENGSLTLSSRAPEQGEATVAMPVRYTGDPIEIGFNPVFLLEVLRVVREDEVTFAFKEPNRPGVIRLGDDFVYVIMPVNLSSG